MKNHYKTHKQAKKFSKALSELAFSWRGCGEKGTLLHCWWECKLVQPLWRTVWIFLKKLEIELSYGPELMFLNCGVGEDS